MRTHLTRWWRHVLIVLAAATLVHGLVVVEAAAWWSILIAGSVWAFTLLAMAFQVYRIADRTTRELNIWLQIGLDLIMVVDADERVLCASGGWLQALGYQPEELLGRRWSDFVHPADLRSTQQLTAEMIRNGVPIVQLTNRWRHKNPEADGTPRWVWLEWNAVAEGGSIYATAKLLASRLEHEAVMSTWSKVTTDLMGVASLHVPVTERKFDWVNDAWTRVLGWSPNEIYAMRAIDLIFPEDAPRLIERDAARRHQGQVAMPAVYRIRVKTAPGEPPAFRWFEWKSVALDGKLYGSGRDITIEKEQQERMAKAIRDLEESNRDLEKFASVAAHQLRSPPRTILGVARALEEDYGDKLDEAGRVFLRDIRENAEQMGEIVNGLYRFSKVRTVDEMVVEPVNLDALLLTIRDMKAKRGCFAEGNRKLSVEKLPMVLGNPVLIQEVLINLIDNGFKFNKSPVQIVRVWATSREDGRWDIHVGDNGVGIDPKYHKKLFQMFQRMHPAYAGTGVGLAVVKSIVEKLGGEVRVQSDVGRGSVFTFDLAGAP